MEKIIPAILEDFPIVGKLSSLDFLVGLLFCTDAHNHSRKYEERDLKGAAILRRARNCVVELQEGARMTSSSHCRISESERNAL